MGYVYNVYISPNGGLQAFLLDLEDLMRDIRDKREPVVVTGDFNARHPLWGGTMTTKRGEELAAFAADIGLCPVNDGIKPTLTRHNGTSYIDLTLVSGTLVSRVRKWKVLEEFSWSDHSYVLTEIGEPSQGPTYKWVRGVPNEQALTRKIKDLIGTKEFSEDAEGCERMTRKAYRGATSAIRIAEGKGVPYWMTQEIIEKRRVTLASRRRYTRARRRNDENLEDIKLEYTNNKKQLGKEISKSKREKWENLCDALNEDPYGQGYRIVKQQMNVQDPRVNLADGERVAIFRTLFVTEVVEEPELRRREVQAPRAFTEEELDIATDRIKTGKAPGPDKLPPGAVKTAIKAGMKFYLGVFNAYWRTNRFPNAWKETKLLLIEKPKKVPGEAPKYRPICLINVLAKVYENLIKARLTEELEEGGGLSQHQFGFRKGRSTVHAMDELLKVARGNNRAERPRWCIIILLDVKNAFNSAKWGLIVRKLEDREISGSLVNTIKNYFEDREVIVDKNTRLRIGAGVPQGSVLGPTLWNVLYDDVMKVETPGNIKLICNADDLAVIATAKNKNELIKNANITLGRIQRWMREHELELALGKTKAVLTNTYRINEQVEIEIDGWTITPDRQAEYLGLTIDRNLSFGSHIAKVTEKADRVIGALSGLMTNLRGPSAEKRKAIFAAAQSVIMYAAPVWEEAMRVGSYKRALTKTQRRINILVTSAYRTVSNEAAAVVGGSIPIHLLLAERKKLFNKGRVEQRDRREEREETLRSWQFEWENATKGAWTRKLIRNIRQWTERKYGHTDFHLTQMLTGHGCFNKYLYSMKKRTSPICLYCEEEDDAEHTFFGCAQWNELRIAAEANLSTALTPENIVAVMIQSSNNWETITRYIRSILTRKEKDERALGY